MGTPLAIDPHEAVEAPSIDAGTVTADAGVDANDSSVPEENREKGDVPPVASAEEGARRLLAAIKADDPALAAEFFFPASAFDLVKAMLSPGTYHKKLEAFYEEDIHTEHDRYFGAHTFEYDSFEMGRCEWMEPLSQGNKLPYWSCRNSRILARSGTKLFDYRIRYMINWGPNWYVIHLGPVRDV